MSTEEKLLSQPRALGDDLILRRATPADAQALIDFNAALHHERDSQEPDARIGAWVRDLTSGEHPTCGVEDFTLVKDTRTGEIVSSLNLISQTWSYEGIPFQVGRPELVGTHPDYRRRGLVRAQFEMIHQWSEAQGKMVQAITGIPWYYRQFGYEMTMTLGGGRTGYKPNVPQLKKGENENENENEPYSVRPATESDLAFIADLYERAAQRQPVYCIRDMAQWRYELNGREAQNVTRRQLCIVETAEEEPVGYVIHPSFLSGASIALTGYELKPGVSWLAVTPSVIRYLWAIGGEYAARDETSKERAAFQFKLGAEHPVYAPFIDRLPKLETAYAWYIRVPDLPGFVRRIGPALERRLADSFAVGHTGALKISLYRTGLQLTFEQGRLSDVTTWTPTPEEWGMAAFPDLTFLQILFGYRTMEELETAFADCWVSDEHQEKRALLNVLFPKRPSDVWPVD